MTTPDEYHRFGKFLERQLNLRTSPIAIKMLQSEADIPDGAIRPQKDWGEHFAQCQAFSMSRRQGASIAMMAEDHWCWAPLIGYGMKDFPEGSPAIPFMIDDEEANRNHQEKFPRLEQGKYTGLVSAPLKTTNFDPDLVLVYSNTAQLRSMLMAIKVKKGFMITSLFDPIDSCVYSVVPVLLTNQYRITLPDPGEYERAMAGEDEIILSVPGDKLADLEQGLKKMESMKLGYRQMAMQMQPDFPRPDLYRQLYDAWGLVVEEDPVPWRRL
jgi:uncharacterized protein (DUF169 family)